MSRLKSSFRFESEVELFEVRNTGSELFEVLSSSISINIECFLKLKSGLKYKAI